MLYTKQIKNKKKYQISTLTDLLGPHVRRCVWLPRPGGGRRAPPARSPPLHQRVAALRLRGAAGARARHRCPDPAPGAASGSMLGPARVLVTGAPTSPPPLPSPPGAPPTCVASAGAPPVPCHGAGELRPGHGAVRRPPAPPPPARLPFAGRASARPGCRRARAWGGNAGTHARPAGLTAGRGQARPWSTRAKKDLGEEDDMTCGACCQ